MNEDQATRRREAIERRDLTRSRIICSVIITVASLGALHFSNYAAWGFAVAIALLFE